MRQRSCWTSRKRKYGSYRFGKKLRRELRQPCLSEISAPFNVRIELLGCSSTFIKA